MTLLSVASFLLLLTIQQVAAIPVTARDDPQTSLTLDPGVIAQGFNDDGQNPPVTGQVASLTSTNNFINFCLTVPDLPLTNGLQIRNGSSCNPAPMGIIAAQTNMPSAKFVFPTNGAVIKENTPFTVQLAVNHLATGFFTNSEKNFLAAPQQLDDNGDIQGLSNIVIETLDSLNQTTPTDPRKFAFAKGLNQQAVDGILSGDVAGGLPAGTYRIGSYNSAANHQPVLVSVAQHGLLDDVVYFTVNAEGQ